MSTNTSKASFPTLKNQTSKLSKKSSTRYIESSLSESSHSTSNSTASSNSSITSSDSSSSSICSFESSSAIIKAKMLESESFLLAFPPSESDTNFGKHKFDLNDDEYDKLKLKFLDLAYPTEYKLLNLIPDDGAQNNIGSWSHANQSTQGKIITASKPLISRPTFTSSNATNSLCNYYRNFNDWRSHLIYYKQIKGYNKSLPDGFRETHSKTPIIKAGDILLVKPSEPAANKPTVPSLVNLKEDSNNLFKSLLKTQILQPPPAQHKNQENESYKNIQNLKINSTQLLNILSNTTTSNIATNSLNTSIQNSPNTSSKSQSLPNTAVVQNGPTRTNIDFKMESQRRLNELPNQKCIPYIKGTRAGGGVLRVASRENQIERTATKYQLQTVPTNLINTLISNTQTNASILNPNSIDQDDHTYYTITSLESTNSNALKKSSSSNSLNKPGKKIIAFYSRVNDSEYTISTTTQANSGKKEQTTSATPDLVQQQTQLQQQTSANTNKPMKALKPVIKINDKYQIGQPSLANFIANANLIQANGKLSGGSVTTNFKKLTSRLQKQHEQLLMQQQQDQHSRGQANVEESKMNSSDSSDETRATNTDEKLINLMNHRVKFTVAN